MNRMLAPLAVAAVLSLSACHDPQPTIEKTNALADTNDVSHFCVDTIRKIPNLKNLSASSTALKLNCDDSNFQALPEVISLIKQEKKAEARFKKEAEAGIAGIIIVVGGILAAGVKLAFTNLHEDEIPNITED